MTTTPIYERILDELAAGEMAEIEREIFTLLRRAYPSSVTRERLVEELYGYTPTDINGDTKDRKNRLVIQAMREKFIPIVSSSGESGYRLDVSQEAFDEMINELRSRRDRMDERIFQAIAIKAKIRMIGIDAIPTTVPQTAKQLSFMER